MTTSLGQPHAAAIFWFFLFVAVTLGITFWAARRTRSDGALLRRRAAASPASRTASPSPATT